MRRALPFLRDAWHLARPYFRAEERWSARLLLAAIIILNLSLVGIDVVLNFWNGAFYDSLQDKDWNSFISLLFLGKFDGGSMLPGFCLLAGVYILIAVYRTYLNQWLQIRWRRWLTARFLDDWLADRAYYRISLSSGIDGLGTDNPDQRIADDLHSFTTDTLSIGLDLLSTIVSLVSFIGILWALSGPMTLFGLAIPGYLVWVALLYALVGSTLTQMVGKPLAFLRFRQQKVEADFRFALARFRENTESVALYGGEANEHRGLSARFAEVVSLWWMIMRRIKFLNALTAGYGQVASIFPIVVAAPRYFSGAIPLGGLTRIASAFGRVQGAMSWFVDSYGSLAAWFATIERLATFQRAIQAARLAYDVGPRRETAAGADLELDRLTLRLPDGQVLLEAASAAIAPGEHVLISGRSGSGKSTLLRAIAGIWPFGDGAIRRPPGRFLFLPQRAYLPLGSLRHALSYPQVDDIADDARLAEVLDAVDLAHLLPRLDDDAPWTQLLSGGEQQRLAIARALLVQPDWLFLDEATASLDPDGEARMYALLRTRLPAATIVSVAHRPALADAHERLLRLERPGPQAGHLGPAAPAV